LTPSITADRPPQAGISSPSPCRLRLDLPVFSP
jgi:hypothetical protein